jgi:hypothetical protein
MDIYKIQDVPHPFQFNRKIRTLVGPGLIATSTHRLLGVSIETVISDDQLTEIGGQLEHVFVMGRRAVQTEIRHALGIKRDGNEFRAMGD